MPVYCIDIHNKINIKGEMENHGNQTGILESIGEWKIALL